MHAAPFFFLSFLVMDVMYCKTLCARQLEPFRSRHTVLHIPAHIALLTLWLHDMWEVWLCWLQERR